jgi:hypothetical protein
VDHGGITGCSSIIGTRIATRIATRCRFIPYLYGLLLDLFEVAIGARHSRPFVGVPANLRRC